MLMMIIIVKQLIGQRKHGHALLHLEKKRYIVYKEEREREREKEEKRNETL